MKKGSDIVRSTIARKNIVYLILSILIVVGIAGLIYMDKDEFPAFEIKQGLVVGVYPGASEEEVMTRLTEPLENMLFSMSEVSREATYSYSRNGMCYVFVDLTVPASKKDEAWSKIKLRIESFKPMLPEGVLAVAVLDDFSEVSSLLIALESPDKSYTEMRDYADDLSERLKKIPSLSSVSYVGHRDEEIAILADAQTLSKYGIEPSSLMFDYRTAGIQFATGNIENNGTRSPIHVDSPMTGEQQVADRIVMSTPSGEVVRLKDVAQIQRRYVKPSSYVDYNGSPAIVMSVVMRTGNNIVAFGKEVDKVLDEFKKELPQSVKVSIITDQPKVVGASVASFLRDLVISMLVVIFVMLMLFPMRSALIASSGVPVCTAVTLAIMFLTGVELNTVTLAALIVVLGMIVDDSIITMDGYMVKLGSGMSKVDAACASAKELFMPMFMATFAISAMFFPVKVIITGYLGDFVQLFPWVIAIALAVSLAYAMLVVPSLEVRFINSPKNEDKGIIARTQSKFFNALQNGYEWLQAICFKHPKLTILSGVAAVGLGVLMFLQLNIQMMPKAARDFFAIEVYLEGSADTKSTKQVCDSLYQILSKDSRVKSVTSFSGVGAPRFTATYAPQAPAPNYAQLIVNTTSIRDTEAMLKEYETEYEHHFPNAIIRFKQMDYQAVTAPVAVRLHGAPYQEMKPYADTIKSFMYGMTDMLKWIHTDCDDYIPVTNVVLDSEEAARLGVNKTMLSLSLMGSYEGQTLASIYEDDKKIPVTLYNTASDQGSSSVANQLVQTSIPGVKVPLRQVAQVKPEWEPASVTRFAGEESITIAADLKSGYSHPVAMNKIDDFIENEILPILPDDIDVSYEGLSMMNDDVGPEIFISFICAVMVLFFFMVFHFKKISLAILTLALSLLCLFGASFGLWIFNVDVGMTSVLGLISLVGIIVRNGIIMFEYAEELRFSEGMSVKEAAEQAGKRRMRPIFLTSCTTALGVIPMIISRDALWLPMGVVICFGTILSILLVVLIMPVSYWQLFRHAETKKV